MYLKGFESSITFLTLKNACEVVLVLTCLVSTIPFAFMDTLNLIEHYLYPFT